MIKYIFFVLLYYLLKFINSFRAYKIRVLTLHNITVNEIEKLEILFNWISQDWQFITPDEFKNYKAGKFKLKRNSLLITIDDGFQSIQLINQRIFFKYK